MFIWSNFSCFLYDTAGTASHQARQGEHCCAGIKNKTKNKNE